MHSTPRLSLVTEAVTVPGPWNGSSASPPREDTGAWTVPSGEALGEFALLSGYIAGRILKPASATHRERER